MSKFPRWFVQANEALPCSAWELSECGCVRYFDIESNRFAGSCHDKDTIMVGLDCGAMRELTEDEVEGILGKA